MAFTTPTLDEAAVFLVAHFKALFPDDDVSETSFNYLWCLTLAAAITDVHAHVKATQNDLLPDTSEGDMLARWATIRGVVKKGATPARKASALRVYGVAASAVPVDTQLRHEASGLLFKIATADVVGPGGYVDADVVAIDTGSQTRLSAGEILRFVGGAPAGLEEDAELQISLDEDGEDEESDGALRLRVLARFSSPPLGGAAADYVQWALEETGIAAAYAYPLRAGLGTVDLAALHAGSGATRVLSAPEVAELQAAIDEKRPAGMKAFRVLQVVATAVNVEVLYTPDGQAQHAPDWDDATPPTVLAWTAGTRTVQLNGGTRPASMQAGDRVIFKPAGLGGTGRERVIESLSGADSFVLEVDPTGDEPGVGDTVYSGGPLTEPIRAAVQALIDGLGTANPDATRYGAWEGNLRPTAIGRAAIGVDGVLDADVAAPAALTEASDPSYPDDDEIGLIIAGLIIARRKH